MFKFVMTINIVWSIGFVLFDAQVAFGLQAAFVAGWALTRIPGKVWLAIAEGIADMMPWIMI